MFGIRPIPVGAFLSAARAPLRTRAAHSLDRGRTERVGGRCHSVCPGRYVITIIFRRTIRVALVIFVIIRCCKADTFTTVRHLGKGSAVSRDSRRPVTNGTIAVGFRSISTLSPLRERCKGRHVAFESRWVPAAPVCSCWRWECWTRNAITVQARDDVRRVKDVLVYMVLAWFYGSKKKNIKEN